MPLRIRHEENERRNAQKKLTQTQQQNEDPAEPENAERSGDDAAVESPPEKGVEWQDGNTC